MTTKNKLLESNSYVCFTCGDVVIVSDLNFNFHFGDRRFLIEWKLSQMLNNWVLNDDRQFVFAFYQNEG